MIAALQAAAEADSNREAGTLLAEAGWAVFPVPHGRKFDHGSGAFTYRDATTDPQKFALMAIKVMSRHGVEDVNIAVSPWRCATPLIGIDLDGTDAVAQFPGTPHILTSGKGGGAHVYVAGAPHPVGGTNPWGGELRSDKGHLMLPPSIINGQRDYYRPTGAAHFLDWADVSGLADAKASTAQRTVTPVPIIAPVVNRLSVYRPHPAAAGRLRSWLRRIEAAPVGTRYPTMVSAVAAAVALAHAEALPLRWALDSITTTYARAVAGEGRDAEAQVQSAAAWVLASELTA